MKTSNILLLTAFSLIVGSIVFFDLTLKSAWLSGSYKDTFKDYLELGYKNFDAIDLDASTSANLILKQGPFSVRIDPTAADFVHVDQRAGRLHITAAFAGSYINPRPGYVLVISCPSIKQFNADALYIAGDLPVIDTLASEDFRWRPTFIRGFTADSLIITGKHAGSVILLGNHIRVLNATIGIGNGSRTDMTILGDNQIGQANLNILNKSQLKLDGAAIGHLNYTLADSARLLIQGTANSLVNKNTN
jgi:hypothetical protein